MENIATNKSERHRNMDILQKISYVLINLAILYVFIRSLDFAPPLDVELIIITFVICFNVPAIIRAIIILFKQ